MYLKLTVIIVISLFTISCATGGSWKIKDVAPIKREWRRCDARLDGDKAGKGFCYISQECKTFIIEKCRPIHLFCAYTDEECNKKYKLNNMILKTKDSL